MKNWFLTALLMSLLALAQPVKAQDQLPAGMEYITSGITMRMICPVTPEGKKTFQIDWQTNQIYKCTNYMLVATVEQPEDRLNFYFKGIQTPDECLTELGPATLRTDLTGIKPGKYKVNIWINKELFKAHLEVSATGYTWTMKENPDLLKMLNPKLWVMPEGMVWGYAEYRKRDHVKTAEALIRDLKALGLEEKKLTGGDYGEFYVYSFGFEELPIEDRGYRYGFYFYYPGDIQPVRDLLAQYHQRHGNDFRIVFGTDRGEWAHSWQPANPK